MIDDMTTELIIIDGSQGEGGRQDLQRHTHRRHAGIDGTGS